MLHTIKNFFKIRSEALLGWCVNYNYKWLTKALLWLGVNPNISYKDLGPLVHLSINKTNLKILECLIQYDADVNIKFAAKTPLERTMDQLESSWEYISIEIANLLIRSGADINVVDRLDRTILHRLSALGERTENNSRLIWIEGFGPIANLIGLGIARQALISPLDKQQNTPLLCINFLKLTSKQFKYQVKQLVRAGATHCLLEILMQHVPGPIKRR